MKSFALASLFLLACSSNAMTTGDAAVLDANGPLDAGQEASGNSCSSAVEMIVKPVALVSMGEVTILSEAGGVRTIFVDASAGGMQGADVNPRVYLDLETGKRVDITDVDARAQTTWDLALRRYVIFTNSGDAGKGMGGALAVFKSFDSVTMADASGKSFGIEAFVDPDCNQNMDPLGGLLTTFSDWYNYNSGTMVVSPKPNFTFVVRGRTGKLYKLAIQQYYATPDGGMGMAGGRFVLKVAPL